MGLDFTLQILLKNNKTLSCFIPYLHNSQILHKIFSDWLMELYHTEIAFVFCAGFEQVTVRSEDVVEIHSIGVLEQNLHINEFIHD